MRLLADDILAWVPPFANLITIIAGVIAFFGVLFAYLSAAKLEVRLEHSHSWPHQLTVTFTSARANPVQNLLITAGSFGGPWSWGDAAARRPALYRHEWLHLMTHSASTTFSDPPHGGELRWQLRDEEGFFFTVDYRHPYLPWRARSETYVWPPEVRKAGEAPFRVTGREQRRILDRLRGPDQPKVKIKHKKSEFAKRWLQGGLVQTARETTDADFSDVVRGHNGPVLVGLVGSWTGELHSWTRHMLDGFAAKHSPRVLVLLVTTDENPEIASTLPSNSHPTFVLLRGGKTVKVETGARTVPELEAVFAHHLR